MKFRPNFIALPLVLIILSSVCLAVDKKRLSDAVAAVDANLKTSIGKQYDESIGKEFSEKYLSSVKQCKQSAPNLDPFDMFLKLSSDGKFQEVLVYPETQLASCTRTALLAGKFSPPPRNDYWINIHMQFKH